MRYSQTVLYDMQLIDGIRALAARISDRMYALNDGRLWMAAHMRRGDCKHVSVLIHIRLLTIVQSRG